MSLACFDCGEDADHMHHVVPRSLGGTKTLPLCGRCHSLVHSHPGLATGALTAAAMAHKRTVGEYTGGRVPFGSRLDVDGSTLLRCEQEQEIIAAARGFRVAGMSLRATGAALAKRGLLPRSGGQWHANMVRGLVGEKDGAL